MPVEQDEVQSTPAPPADTIEELPVLTVRDTVVFPRGMLPITGLACATASLRVKGLVAERRAINKRTREDVFSFLEKKKIQYVPSQTNFFMMEVGRPGGEFAKAMADHKIMIGRVWPAWPTKVRVTVGTQEEMNKFKAAYEAIVA